MIIIISTISIIISYSLPHPISDSAKKTLSQLSQLSHVPSDSLQSMALLPVKQGTYAR